MILYRIAGMGALLTLAAPALAADHAEAPGTQADPAADIGDNFAWYEDGQVTALLTYSPFMFPGDPSMYDDQVLYTIHFDLDADQLSDHDINIRFGQSTSGKWGVQVNGLPGAGAPVQGLVETVIPAPGGMVYAGLRDDPFFFDQSGYLTTLATGDLAFTGTDAIAGANIMVIAVKFDAPSLLGSTTAFQTWTTTSRL